MQGTKEMPVFLGWEDPLEKTMAPSSGILAWRIPWTEEPGKLQSIGSQRVWHDWKWLNINVTVYHFFTTAQNTIICSYVFMSDSDSALGFILVTMIKNDFFGPSQMFPPINILPPLLLLSIVHFYRCISSFDFYVITIILDLFYSSMTPHSLSTSRGRNSSRPLLTMICSILQWS